MSLSSVSTIAANSSSTALFDPSKAANAIASRLMSKLDPQNTGKVSKDSFVSGLTASGVSDADATKIYNSIDTQKNGSITKSDIVTAIQSGNLKPVAVGAAGADAPAGTGSPGGAGGAGQPHAAPGQSGDGSSSTTAEITKLKKEITADQKQLQQERGTSAAQQLETTIASLNSELAQAELGQNVNTTA
ncbi:MAG TPA: EF-hand domain-containing protein [Burkholderiaceae bacterium]|jgi:hypothetical protein